METPLSMRRVTRSMTALNNSAANSNSVPVSRKIEDSETCVSKSRTRNAKQQQDRSALFDITNDSPIVGLAMQTPSSAITKQSNRHKKTPGSGEALLRGQVKTLLQKVEEEAELSKLSRESRPFLHLKSFVNSPMGLLAPTPANTPQVTNLSGVGGISNDFVLVTASPVSEEQQTMKSQVVNDIFEGAKEETLESQKSLITRSLLLDFCEKFETSDSSECPSDVSHVTTGNSESKEKSTPEDDDASVWSIQVNASVHDEDEEEEVIEEVEEVEDEYNKEGEEDGGLVDELCEGISKISMKAKHTRFVYNSDGELEREEECEESFGESSEMLRLKGLPTPKGKHLRFPTEEEDN
ncbi:hypothetical protein SLE2022_359960 [Rubroshorea leprosula]